MSNRICLEPTEFTDVRSGSVSYGFRVFDDYGKGYSNLWESIPDDDLEVLAKALEVDDDDVMTVLDAVMEQKTGIYIGETYYPWEEISHLFDPANAEEDND